MVPSEAASVTAVAACVGVAFVATLLATRRATSTDKRSTGYSRLSGHGYEDIDGVATQASIAAFSDTWPRLLTVLGALSALLFSIFSAVVTSSTGSRGTALEPWILVSGWMTVIVLTVILIRESSSSQRFQLGVLLAASALAIIAGFGLEIYHSARRRDARYFSSGLVRVASLAQVIAGVVIIFASLSLPRRPAVYTNGKLVDAQFTEPALRRYTFAWARPLLDKARICGGLDDSDLPELDYATRSKQLQSRFATTAPAFTKSRPLWYMIYRDHQRTFFRQWSLAVVESVAMMLPPVCLFQVLSLLEKHNDSGGNVVDLWFWVTCLGTSSILRVFLETWLDWVSFAILATPIRSQLYALIFVKSLHMKDVKGANGPATESESHPKKARKGKGDQAGEADGYELEILLSDEDDSGGADDSQSSPVNNAGDGDDSKSSEGAQGPINLLGVDVQRFSDFCGYSVDLLRSLIKVTLAIIFLVSLIGWWSTLAGLSVPFLFQPLTKIASKYYTNSQLAVMMARDEKTHVVTEALHGIRQIKFSAIEDQWQRLILAVRERELRAQWRATLWGIFLTFCWISMPILLGAAALSVYAWLSEVMVASVAFTALSVFSGLETTLSVVPGTLTELLDARVSINRIQSLLEKQDKLLPIVEGRSVAFENASITWPAHASVQEGFVLRDINLQFPNHQLSCISGKTGSGKSLLLAAIIGEADLLGGRIFAPKPPSTFDRHDERANGSNWIIPSARAFVAQIPWIENASLKTNILYGLPFDPYRYSKVLHACAMDKDLEMLPDGEETEVGATGINLSGGQRWRLTFARALYSRAGILVLDDIFSAVDAHVGRHVLENGICGDLGFQRTIILVTHHIGLVSPFASYLVELGDDGYIKSAVWKQAEKSQQAEPNSRHVFVETLGDDLEDLALDEIKESKQPAKKFVEDESREHGRVDSAVYKTYLDASGGRLYWTVTLSVFVVAALAVLGRSYWLTIWTNYSTRVLADGATVPSSTAPRTREVAASESHDVAFYLSLYVAISLFATALISIKITIVWVAALRAARKLFDRMTYAVLRARLRWLDTVPVGRILNRFISDFALVDSRLGGDLHWFANGLFSMITIAGAALFVSFWMVVPVLTLAVACLYATYLYLDGARDTKRLESTTKSPIFELFGSALSGLATIRSFDRIEDYVDRMCLCIDAYGKSTWYILLTTQWMAFWQGLLGTLFALCIACSVVLIPGMNASLAGFALSFALEFSQTTVTTISKYTSLELDMNSTERVVEYMELPIEEQGGSEPRQDWPSQGKIVVRGLEVGYAEDLPSVLKGLNITVEPRERVGVVGRTGSGKSSLTLALFRFLEARKGSILIDGQDIAKIRLRDLRHRLAIIPQDPVLFSGTLRSNLDPFNEHTDSAILDALERVRLLDNDEEPDRQNGHVSTKNAPKHNTNIFHDLHSPISRGGLNLSQGQRQLLCLARAIITRPKIMILDEATSAVDMATDALIQRSIREDFRDSSLLVIAHRLSTVADFDKVLVMSDGRAVEFDEPRKLVEGRGAFWALLNESGEKEAVEQAIGSRKRI